MKNKKVVLCVVAHPDDEALGPGGTLIKHSEQGDTVNVLILSEGEESKSPNNILNKNRKKNAKEWAKLNNCKLIKLCNFPDQRLDVIPQLDIVKEIERTVELIKPDIVYTHYPGDLNLDHQVVSQSTLTAIRPISYHNINPEIRAFETPSSSDQVPMIGKYIFSPNFYVSINKQWKKKIKGLQIYSSEIKSKPHARSIDAIKALAIKRGAESGFEKAEAFIILRKTWR